MAGASPRDFFCHLPSYKFIYKPTTDMWPASSIDARFGRGAAEDMAQHHAVEQATWAPGEARLIKDKLIANGVWIARRGSSVFNLYRPPTIMSGNAKLANPWRNLIKAVFPLPGEAEHIEGWFAWRVQHPEIKINHALVMGGDPRIGKDTIIAGAREAVGAWNVSEASPEDLFDKNNATILQAAIMRISEARDMGESRVDRYQFYNRTKTYMASPPETLAVQDKYIGKYSIMNLVGVIITTNEKTGSLYLPPDDGRHFVAWSNLTEKSFAPGYFKKMWAWYEAGGYGHIAAYLRTYDLSKFDPKKSPPKTAAFWEIVGASRAPEDSELGEILGRIGNLGRPPDAVTLAQIIQMAAADSAHFDDFYSWIMDRKHRRHIPGRMERAGYQVVRNPDDKSDGQWHIGGRRVTVYARKQLTMAAQFKAVSALIRQSQQTTADFKDAVVEAETEDMLA